jgi:glycosyltransferase involved in cell wall biosynthesis
VVIPAYNAQEYLAKCLESVLNQTFRDFEVILINDGSSDRTEEICLAYASRDSRIRYYSQVNQGVSVTRNKGLGYALGDYLVFVDSDDWVESDYIDRLASSIGNSDLVICGVRLIPGGECRFAQRQVSASSFFTDFLRYRTDRYANYYLHTLWNKIFRTEVIRKGQLRFRSDISICEDYIFILQYLSLCESISFINHVLYNYRYVSSSLTSAVRANTYSDVVFSCDYTKNYVEENELIMNKRTAWMRYSYSCYAMLIKLFISGLGRKRADYRFVIKDLRKRIDVMELFTSRVSIQDLVIVMLFKLRIFFLIRLLTRVVYRIKQGV